MNEQEYTETYEALTSILEERHLEWVANQVTEQIQLGKTEARTVKTLKESSDEHQMNLLALDSPSARLLPGPKATFSVTTEYASREKLLLLIDAIEQVAVNVTEMAYEITSFFGTKVGVEEISFSPDEDDTESFTISQDESLYRNRQASELKQLLSQLRSAINDH